MKASDLDMDTFYTTTGKDIWKMVGFYTTPSCTIENVDTKETMNFGMNGLTAKSFHRIEMPIKPQE